MSYNETGGTGVPPVSRFSHPPGAPLMRRTSLAAVILVAAAAGLTDSGAER